MSIDLTRTPITPVEAIEILGISEADYENALAMQFLEKNAHFDERFSQLTAMHSFYDLLTYALRKCSDVSTQNIEETLDQVQALWDDLVHSFDDEAHDPSINSIDNLTLSPVFDDSTEEEVFAASQIWSDLLSKTLSTIEESDCASRVASPKASDLSVKYVKVVDVT